MRLSVLVVALAVAKGVVWSALVPLWHFPDEQAHFAQVSYLAELGGHPPHILGIQPGGPEYAWDLSEEILVSERLLGTERHNGINRFTYHPEYRIPYTDTTVGLHELEIASLPRASRTTYVKAEAANYPHLYYWTMALPYRLFMQGDLFVRVFAVRMTNALYAAAFALIVLQIARYLWPKASFYATAFTLFVSFHPMFTFVSAGVTSDNAINLWYAAFILLCLRLLYGQLTKTTILFALTLVAIGPFVKQQALLVYPFLTVVAWYALYRYAPRLRKKLLWFSAIAGLGTAIGISVLWQNAIFRAYLSLPLEPHIVTLGGLAKFGIWTMQHTIREVFPWYWGVFNWLGVVLPRTTNRIIIRVVGLATIGFLLLVVRKVVHKRYSKEDKALLALFVLAVWYFVAITLWDYVFFSRYNYSFGIQGRYFFPVIVPHMALLLKGVNGYFPKRFDRFFPHAFLVLVLAMVVLNFHALWVVLGSYYSLNSWSTFFTQASQYKPLLFKYPVVLVWMSIYLTALILTGRALLLAFRQLILQKGE